MTDRTFGVDTSGGAQFTLTRLAPLLEYVHERLTGIVIECVPWADFIARWDRPGMLFYLDPPYFGNETDYGKVVFSAADFGRMAKVLASNQGRFLLSINDRPEIRETFGTFRFEEVSLTCSVNGGKGRPAKELLVSNAITSRDGRSAVLKAYGHVNWYPVQSRSPMRTKLPFSAC